MQPASKLRFLTNPLGKEIEALLQFYKDETTKQANQLASIIRSTNCELKKLRYSQATATAQYNGWLAASQLKLEECTKLIAAGSTILVMKCQTKEVTFQTEITKCGPQLRFQEFTLNIDGFELVRYSPCYSNLGFVNVNGKPYVHRNESWELMDIKTIRVKDPITSNFKYSDVQFKKLLSIAIHHTPTQCSAI